VRGLLIAIAVAFLGASPALAKPKVAVTPVDGDADDKMGAVVREALDGELAVVAPKEVERAMSKLGLSGELEESDAQRLRQKLDAAVVVQGKLGRAGQKKTVKLSVWVRGKKPSDFNVQYKSAASEKFREVVRDALLKRIGSISDLGEEEKPKKRFSDIDEDRPKKKLADADEEKDRPKKKLADADEEKDRPKKKLADADEDKDRPKKKLADADEDKDRPKKKKLADADEDKDRPKKKLADADEDKPKKPSEEEEEKDRPKKKKKVASADADADEDNPKVRKRKRSGDGDGEGVSAQPARPQPVARVDAGLSYGARYLTWAVGADSTGRPPKVFTPAGAGRIKAELYPLAFADRTSPLAGIGLFGEYDKTFALSIDVPGTMGKSVTIDQAHYAMGVRYRLPIGATAISAGVAYTSRHYIANRKPLDSPTQLDMPDVDYAGISPVVGARTPVASRFSLFAEANIMLALSAGAIAQTSNYGPGDVFGVGGNAGVDIALAKQIGVRIAAEYNQINLKFKGNGAMSGTRKVTAATDRDFGGSATLAAWF